jgi:photosystem II stability/assembly factor-like uncharacterized protein
MKKLLFTLVTIYNICAFSQEGIHLQWHRQSAASVFNVHNSDSAYHIMRIANTSTNNVIAVVNLKNEKWSYIMAPSLNLNTLATSKAVMKNNLVGYLGGKVTNDGWQTSTTPTTTPIGLVVEGATSQGFYGYAQISSSPLTYETKFSSDGANWVGVQTSTVIPQFTKTKNKIYTIHNNLLKSSANGGASFTPVNATYTLNGVMSIPNNDTLFVMSTQLLRSFDGGATWSGVAYPSISWSQVANKNGKEIIFYNTVATPKELYYSNNSGASFTTHTLNVTYNSGDKLIGNENAFYLYPSYKSINGSNWIDFLPNAHAPKPYDITYTGDVAVAAIAQGYFGYSLNKGYNFSYVPNKVSNDGDLMAAKAIDANTFLAADRKGQIFMSTNQGTTWIQKVTSTFNNIPRKFSVSDDKSVIVMSAIGSAYVSGNSGSTFSFLNTTVGNGHYQTMRPVSNKVVDVAPLFLAPTFTLSGYEFYEITGSNVRTLTSTLTTTGNFDIVDVQMADDNVGYLMLRNTTTNATDVYKTTNAWISTSLISSIPSPSVGIRSYDGKYGNIQTFGTNTVIISGSGNPVNNQTNYYHISTDGGSTWNIIYPQFNVPTNNLGNRIYKMSFYNPNEYMALISDFLSGGPQASIGVYINSNANGGSTVGIKEFYQTTFPNQLMVYPNPTSDNLFLSTHTDRLSNLYIKIYNLYGQVVESIILSSIDDSIDVSNLKNGVYFITLKNKNNHYSGKFIKE